jgi:DNA polymerase III epsilon subunit-like protein
MSLATAWGVWLVDLFESDSTLVIHNAAFDLGFLAQLCYEHEGELIGTMLLSQLLYAGAAAQDGSNLPCSGCGG